MTRLPPYVGVSQQITDWWTAHLSEPPLVVIRCARCSEKGRAEPIGEIKRDGEQVMALCKTVQPERTTPSPTSGWSAQTEAELEQRKAEREEHVLRRFQTPEGQEMEVMKKHRDIPAAVASLDTFPSYYCPEHGEIPVDPSELAKFVADTDKPKRTYRA